MQNTIIPIESVVNNYIPKYNKSNITSILPNEVRLAQSRHELNSIIKFRKRISNNLSSEAQSFQDDNFDNKSYVLYSKDTYENIIATARILHDSEHGFPEENFISVHIEELRNSGAKIVEAGRLAIIKHKPKLLRLYYKSVYDVAKYENVDFVIMMIKTKSISSYKRFMSINLLANNAGYSWDEEHANLSLVAWDVNAYQPKFDKWTHTQKCNYSTKGWNDYSRSHLGVFTSIQKEIYEHVAKKVRGNVLDVGCGSGRIMAYIGDNKNVINYTGVDLSTYMLKQANWLKKELCFTNARILNTKIEYLNNKFDSIVSIHSYYAWEDKVSMLKNIYNLLKSSGNFILVTPNNNFDKEKLSHVVKQEILGHPYYENFININYEIAKIAKQNNLYQHIDNLIEILRSIGFKVNTAHNNFFLGGASYLRLTK